LTVGQLTVGISEKMCSAKKESPETEYKTCDDIFCIALSLGHLGRRLLELPAQSVIGSSGTLAGARSGRAIQHHCGQTFSICLCGWVGRSPVRRGCGAQPCEIFVDDFLSIFGKILGLELEDRILVNTEFPKSGPSVTGNPDLSGPFRREVEIDVS